MKKLRLFSMIAAMFMCAISAVAGVTVKVDDASMVELQNENREEVALENGENSVGAGAYIVKTASEVGDYLLYSVKVNGESQTPVNASTCWMLSLEDDDVLEITAKYPVASFDVTFSDPTAVKRAGNETQVSGPVKADAGYKFEYTLKDGYTGTPASGFYLTADTEVTVKAPEVYATVNVDNANLVKILNENRESVALVDGSQSLSAGQYQIGSTQDYMLAGVKVNGEAVAPVKGAAYWMVELAEGDKLDITANYEAKSFGVKINDGEAIKSITTNGKDAEIAQNVASVIPGYKVVITLNEGYTTSNATTFYATEDVEFTTSKLALATVTVDNANLVKITNENRETVAVVAGTQTLSAGNYQIASTQDYMLAGVKVNGEAVAPVKGAAYWMVELAEGDKLDITANYEAKSFSVKFNDGEAIKSITSNGGEVTIAQNAAAVIPGYKVVITLNEGYTTSDATTFYATQDVEFTTSSLALATANIDNANLVKITNENREELTLVDGAQSLSAGQYMIASTQDYMLASVKVNGTAVAPVKGAAYWMVELAAGDKLDITANYAEEAFGVSFNDVAAIKSITSNGQNVEIVSAGEGETASNTAMVAAGYKVVITLNEGYTTTNATAFYATENVDFVTTEVTSAFATVNIDNANLVKITNENREDVAVVEGAQKLSAGNYIIGSTQDYMLAGVKINGEAVAPVKGAAYWMVELAENDVLDITANYEEETYGISFNDAAAIKSVVCNGQELEIAATPVEGQESTYFTAAPAGYKVVITLNEGYTTTNATSFYATENVEFVTTASAALATVNIDNANLVKITNENRETVAVINGAQSLSVGNYLIASTQDYMLAGVKLNGTAVEPVKGAAYWMVELAANDVLDITANYAEEAFGVSFNDAAAIKSITSNGQNVEIVSAGEGETASNTAMVAAGYKVVITLNEGYTTSNATSFYATDNVDFVAVAQTFATVNIDNANLVKITNENRDEVAIVEGAQKLSAGNYLIASTQDYMLAGVKLNGTAVAPVKGAAYWMVEIAENDVLDITANYEAEAFGVTFNDAAAIKSITSNGQEVEITAGGEGETAFANAVVKPGYKVVITLNAGYTTSNATSFYATEDVDFTTTAQALATVNIDNANLVKITNENREELTLVNGAQSLSAGNYLIGSTKDYMLASVKINGTAVAPVKGAAYWMVELAENDVLDITANYEEETYGISFNDAAAIKSVVCNGQELEIAATPVEGQESTYFTAAPAGYKVVVTLNEGYTTSNATAFYATEDVEFTTTKLVYATANIDNANLVKITNENREDLTLVDGAQSLSAGNYIIASTQDYMLASVKINGEAVAPVKAAAYWMVEIAAGDQLDITANYEAESFSVKINDGEAIKSITTNGVEAEIAQNVATVRPGYKVVITLNEGYTTSNATSFYATEDVEFTATKAVYATVNIDNANLVKITNENREEVAVVEGAQKLSAGNYLIASTQDYMLAGVKLNGTAVAPVKGAAYWMVEIAENDVLDITANYEAEAFGVIFNDAAAIKSITSNGQEVEIMTGGEGETGFAQAVVKPGYKVIVTLNEGYATSNATAFYATEDVEFTTTKLAYATIIADAANKAKAISAETRDEIMLLEGENKVYAGDYMILTNDANYALNSVTKGGEAIAETYGYYMVSLAENETVNVVSKWLDEEGEQMTSAIIVNDLAAIASVTAAGTDITEQVAPAAWDEDDNATAYAYAAPMGAKVVVTLNEGYTSESTLNFYATEETYEITTTKLVLAAVNIDNAAKVKIQNENREYITVVDGAQSLSAGTYMIMPTEDYKLNKVTLNNELLTPAYGTSYMVELAENDVLDITANYEAEAFGVTFNDAAAIKSITSNGQEVEITAGGEGETAFANAAVIPGYKVVITLNEGYATENATSFYATEDVEFVTEKLSNIVIAEGGVVGSIKDFTIKARNNGEIIAASANEEAPITLVNKATRETIYTWTAEMLSKIEPTFDEEYNPIALTISLPEEITEPGTYDLVVPAGAFYVGEYMVASDATSTSLVIEAVSGGVELVSAELNANGGKLTFDQSIAFADFAESITCNVAGVTTKNIAAQATLTLDWDNWNVVNVEFSETLEAGEYTLDIPTGKIVDGEQGTNYYAGGQIAFEVAEEVFALQATYPTSGTTVTELPEYVTFMFNQEIVRSTEKPMAVAIQADENEPVNIDPAYTEIIDGNTVKIELTQKIKNQLPATGHFTVYLQIEEDAEVFECNFDVAAEFGVESYELTATGGQIIFNQNVDFVDYASEVTCFVVGAKTKNIATQATLTLDDENYAAVNVEFADTLEAGDYVLQIAEGNIMSTSEEPFYGSIEFSVAETIDPAQFIGKTVLLQNKATGEYLYGINDQNTAMGSLETATAAENAVTAFKVEAAENGYLFRCVTPAGGDYSLWGSNPCYLNSQPNVGGVTFNLGKNQDVENGSTWSLTWDAAAEAWTIQCVANNAYLAGTTVTEDLQAQWVLVDVETTGISTIATAAAVNGKFFENGKIVIVRNGVKYNVNGVIVK